jgi:hypothetical protein
MLGSVRGALSNERPYRDKSISARVPTCSSTRKAIRKGAISRAPDRLGVVEDPGMCESSLDGNREVSGLTCGGTP